jgi:hypothetical protein
MPGSCEVDEDGLGEGRPGRVTRGVGVSSPERSRSKSDCAYRIFGIK